MPWFIIGDLFASAAAIAEAVMRNDDGGGGSLSISFCRAGEPEDSGPLFNHTWQICAIGSKTFKQPPDPFIKGLLKTQRGLKSV